MYGRGEGRRGIDFGTSRGARLPTTPPALMVKFRGQMEYFEKINLSLIFNNSLHFSPLASLLTFSLRYFSKSSLDCR